MAVLVLCSVIRMNDCPLPFLPLLCCFLYGLDGDMEMIVVARRWLSWRCMCRIVPQRVFLSRMVSEFLSFSVLLLEVFEASVDVRWLWSNVAVYCIGLLNVYVSASV